MSDRLHMRKMTVYFLLSNAIELKVSKNAFDIFISY